MKIALACRSILLERALALFLKPYIVSLKQCDFVIADSKVLLDHPVFLIGNEQAHLSTPFSKTTLLLALEEFNDCISGPEIPVGESLTIPLEKSEERDFSLLENKIEVLTEKFRKELVQTIKAHYN